MLVNIVAFFVFVDACDSLVPFVWTALKASQVWQSYPVPSHSSDSAVRAQRIAVFQSQDLIEFSDGRDTGIWRCVPCAGIVSVPLKRNTDRKPSKSLAEWSCSVRVGVCAAFRRRPEACELGFTVANNNSVEKLSWGSMKSCA